MNINGMEFDQENFEKLLVARHKLFEEVERLKQANEQLKKQIEQYEGLLNEAKMSY